MVINKYVSIYFCNQAEKFTMKRRVMVRAACRGGEEVSWWQSGEKRRPRNGSVWMTKMFRGIAFWWRDPQVQILDDRRHGLHPPDGDDAIGNNGPVGTRDV